VTTVLLAALLVFLATKLMRRGIRTYGSETAEQKAAAAETAATSDGDGGSSSAPGTTAGSQGLLPALRTHNPGG
jgi:hypothetical protein